MILCFSLGCYFFQIIWWTLNTEPLVFKKWSYLAKRSKKNWLFFFKFTLCHLQNMCIEPYTELAYWVETDHLDWIGPDLRDLPVGTWFFSWVSDANIQLNTYPTLLLLIQTPAEFSAQPYYKHPLSSVSPYHGKCPHQSWGPLFLLPLWYLTSKSLAYCLQTWTCIMFHPEDGLVKGCLDPSAQSLT